MSRRVKWLEDARDELAEVWLAAPDRNAVTQATSNADRRLSENPTGEGVYLSENLWKLTAPPLVLYFELSENGQLVQVTNVVSARHFE